MDAEFDRCYRAVRSRDRRFDGRFVTAVRTTGVYCRPSCPAQTPKPQNVRFFPHPAAAAAAGYRACRRCRPDAAPGSRDWDTRADLAARALRGIQDGLVDGDGVPGLARRLAVSERHLHRVLVAEVGASASDLARNRRAQTARMLIEHTELPMTTVAFSAGFSSIRQFNDVMRTEFGAPPGALRTKRRPALATAAGTLAVRLQYRPPLALGPLLGWFRARSVPGLELVGEASLRVTVGGALVELVADGDRPEILARIRVEDVASIASVVAGCRRLLDLDGDPAAVDELLAADPLLAASVRRHPGLRVPGAANGFELAVRAVLGQQVSLAAARTLLGRIVAQWGEPLPEAQGGITHRFPAPTVLAAAELESVGLTGARARTVRALAAAVAGGLRLDPSADRQEVRRALLALPGIGDWTTEYIAMRALQDPDAFPATDLVLRRRLGPAGAELSQRWRPWRAYAAMHLWQQESEERA